jgi:hypothetical protein
MRLQQPASPRPVSPRPPSHRPLRPLPPRQLSHRHETPFRQAAPQPRTTSSLLPSATWTLKLLAAVLTGVTITSLLLLWQGSGTSVAPDDNRFDAAFAPFGQNIRQDGYQQSTVYRSAVQRLHSPIGGWETGSLDAALDRAVPSNFPRRVQTVKFTAPEQHFAKYPAPANARANALEGKPLRYLIGTEASWPGREDEVTVVSYSTAQPARRGLSIAYCNLFDEHNTGRYGPYLNTSDTAKQYNEGQIDPRGPGWEKNLREQFERRRKQGFEYVELDNPDAYSIKDVIGAIELAASYDLKVIAKNPGLMGGGATAYVAHPNVHGIIVERGAGSAGDMDKLRRKAGKPTLPTWFVAFGSGRGWAGSVASSAKNYRNMGVTYSSAGEYGNAIDILPPT